jgi:hypothetical protein
MKAMAARLELALVAAAALVVAIFDDHFPRIVPVGHLFVAAALALLVQGFLRDLVRLVSMRRRATTRAVTCVCVESVVGLTWIVTGLALSLGRERATVPMGAIGWPLALACVGIFGTATREIVFDWRARRLRREVDHAARVAWRS